ncbi:hypothetical protein ATO6_04610 [Oceanicola sp. 22II-s10i]|uniref:YbhB/YbcL family Raf kinase inhibitor-like protein n=1 Tax=Oceanicola sp. 22II-s10i TaxID=1317116 RepID=UPI000B5271C0|nr:YbhB/YbcL family Raf kinase inhibitor-like protein [Oceanicola sp. 22II-s10i]OWU86143.1 hypothetical protein ATO6_04610 [Oceanicola sp. 22II-s10i]
MHKSLLAAALLALSAGAASAEMKLSFSGWGNIPSCTSGRPNTVGNPQFTLSGVPAGTETIEFKLVDLDVPSYDHGGARLKMTGSGKVPAGLFKYKSPCPPSGVHTYEWRATAKAGNKVLAKAAAKRRYPE